MQLSGTCRALFALDVGWSIDLARAGATLTTSKRVRFHHKLPVAGGQIESSLPLRLEQTVSPSRLGERDTAPVVEVSLYEFGALCVTWSVPFDGPMEGLVELAAALYDNAELAARSREVAGEVVRALGGAVDRPRVSQPVEDYLLFEVGAVPGGPDRLLAEEEARVARVLRAEPGELSRQEIEGALGGRVSYGPGDACLVDWLGAFLVGEHVQDERFVLELATVELSQLRWLDDQLEREIQEAYGILTRPRGFLRSLGLRSRDLARVARMQADDAVLHEGIDNALKIFGDDYLARLYRTAAARLHVAEWDASIERKLGVLRDVHMQLSDLAAHRRSEVLEWIIIALIAAEILLYLAPGAP